MLPCPWLMQVLGSRVYPGTVKNASSYMVGFVFFKALGIESNCLEGTFKRLLVSFKKRDSVNITGFAVFLHWLCWVFLDSSEMLCLVHTASSHYRGCLINGNVSPALWSSCSSNWSCFFTHRGKRLSMGIGQMEVLQRWWTGWTQCKVGFYGDGWPSQVAVEQESLLTANCKRAGKQLGGLLDQILN